jgi:hypothetical protein
MNSPSSSSSSSPLSGSDGNRPQQQQEQTSATTEPTSSTPPPQQQAKKQGIFEHIMSNKSDHFILSSRHYSYKEALHRPIPLRNNSNSNSSSNTGDSNQQQYALDAITRTCLPYPMVWTPTAAPGQLPPDFSWLANSCGGKAAIGVFGGGIMVRMSSSRILPG